MNTTEDIFETRNPDWVYSRASGEFINKETGECLSRQEFSDEIAHSRDPLLEYGDKIKSATMTRLGEVKVSILNLKEAFCVSDGNEWNEINNPDMEVGETDTGHWKPKFRKEGSNIVEVFTDREFVHGAACTTKIRPEETDGREQRHFQDKEVAEVLDVIYRFIDAVISSKHDHGRLPTPVLDGSALLEMLIDGCRFDNLFIEGESGISELLSLQKNLRFNIENLETELYRANQMLNEKEDQIVELRRSLQSVAEENELVTRQNGHNLTLLFEAEAELAREKSRSKALTERTKKLDSKNFHLKTKVTLLSKKLYGPKWGKKSFSPPHE